MPRIYDNADSVEAIANSLIPTYHPELATAKIKYVFCDKAGSKGGKPVLGKARKVSGSTEFLLESNFIIEIAADTWNDLDPEKRNALIDHLLERCWGEEDEQTGDMKWSMREPDCQEFSTILRRHGVWTDDLQGFVSVASEINLDGIVAETSVQDTQKQ